MSRTDKPVDVFPCVEVVLFHWSGKWIIRLRVRPRTHYTIEHPYYNKPDALRFGNTLARRLSTPVRVLEEK